MIDMMIVKLLMIELSIFFHSKDETKLVETFKAIFGSLTSLLSKSLTPIGELLRMCTVSSLLGVRKRANSLLCQGL